MTSSTAKPSSGLEQVLVLLREQKEEWRNRVSCDLLLLLTPLRQAMERIKRKAQPLFPVLRAPRLLALKN